METDQAVTAPEITAGRVYFARGRAHAVPARDVPDGLVAGRYSVLSPGTERRRLTATSTGPACAAGYMTLGEDPASGGWTIAPVPHGAPFAPETAGAVTAPAGTTASVAALGRFQQMALLGLDRVPPDTGWDDTVVVGSGPVALGCVLDLHRRGARRIRVLTARRTAPIGRVPGATCVAEVAACSAHLVVDAVGAPGLAADLVAPGGVLGLLGTPDTGETLPAAAVYRRGAVVVGMHELAPAAPGAYQAAYTTAVAHLDTDVPTPLLGAWCRTVPGERATEVFALLGTPGRPAEPVIVFAWAP